MYVMIMNLIVRMGNPLNAVALIVALLTHGVHIWQEM